MFLLDFLFKRSITFDTFACCCYTSHETDPCDVELLASVVDIEAPYNVCGLHGLLHESGLYKASLV